MENWKDINGYEGCYQVSDDGKVRSLDRFVDHPSGGKAFRKGFLLKQRLDKDGYCRVSLKKNQIGNIKYVHRLVAFAFIENPENKKQVNHKDGIKNHNNKSNLEWVTTFENRQHAYDTGLQKARKGETNNWCKLKYSDVEYIRNNYKKRIVTNKMLAKKFNVTEGCIQAITSGKNWNL